MVRPFIAFLSAVATVVILGRWCWAWTRAHDQASRMAATIAPKPFSDYPDHCAFGIYPDSMNDWDIAQGENGRWAVWLLVKGAVEALKSGDAARACFLASVASHYPQDALCMSHSQILKMGRSDANPDLLPLPLRPLLAKLPVERKTVTLRRYGRSNSQTISNQGFFVTDEPPGLLRPLFDAVQGYVHDWLEDTAAALSLPEDQRRYIVGSETLKGHREWTWEEVNGLKLRALVGTVLEGLTAYEKCDGVEGWSFYHRWLTAHYQGEWLLPFALFEGWDGKPKFRDFEGLKAVFAEEFRIAVQTTAALYRYVAVASQTQVQADWGKLSEQDAKLDAMAEKGVAIVVTEKRNDWRRAAEFLRQEFVFGARRQNIRQAKVTLSEKPEDVRDALDGKRWRDWHMVVLEKSDAYRLQIRPEGERLIVRLQVPVNDLEAMGNMVDLLLDEGKAPLWSVSPPSAVLNALQQIGAGTKLMEALKRQQFNPEALLEFVRPKGKPIPFRNTDEDKKKFAELVANVQRTPGLGQWVRWWTGMLEAQQ
ncbi:hypothetical protein Q2T83_03005 [Fervidibacter sacchari]|uniref:Phospholipase C/D domain-containing protein n=1 Tax=Candidatus Fervidibacter sacchari TaxID=1448929 RepID=A0ABT2ESS8_9BACT|nr:hypothetical protein [Candidatus Fervidibacter sacchari]MCS3919963.1 hypothetical protein [Candidatus Fervidibacter sacchari]WKU16802.1 hypothetical protein Q2T83_03005 [Candidatus Fervidibacter sacchari]